MAAHMDNQEAYLSLLIPRQEQLDSYKHSTLTVAHGSQVMQLEVLRCTDMPDPQASLTVPHLPCLRSMGDAVQYNTGVRLAVMASSLPMVCVTASLRGTYAAPGISAEPT